jgi:hypothetical protein
MAASIAAREVRRREPPLCRRAFLQTRRSATTNCSIELHFWRTWWKASCLHMPLAKLIPPGKPKQKKPPRRSMIFTR